MRPFVDKQNVDREDPYLITCPYCGETCFAPKFPSAICRCGALLFWKPLVKAKGNKKLYFKLTKEVDVVKPKFSSLERNPARQISPTLVENRQVKLKTRYIYGSRIGPTAPVHIQH